MLGERIAARVPAMGIASAMRLLDVGGVYAELTVRIENGAWGGALGNRLVVYPRPSRPVEVPVFTDGWPDVAEFDGAEALRFALDRVGEQAVDWVERFVLPLPAEGR
jgi:hypothetical protein